MINSFNGAAGKPAALYHFSGDRDRSRENNGGFMAQPICIRKCLLFFLCLCFAGSVAGQIGIPADSIDLGLGGSNAIVGTVFAPSGQRLEMRIKIRLATMTRGDRTTMTNEKGNFSFRGLPGGSYTIIIDKEKEYEPFSQQVDIIQLRGSPPQSYYLNIRLNLKEKHEVKPGVINTEFAGVPQKSLDFYNQAIDLAKTGDHRAAIEQLLLAIAEHPDFMLAVNELGVQYLRLNELAKADESFQSALKLKPEAFAPLINRGIVLVLMRRFEEAEAILRKAIKIKEQSAVGHYFLGQALANLGRFDDAEKELITAIALGGDEMKEAHRFLAIIYSARGDKKRAADQLETYLRLTPAAPDAEQLRKVIQQLKESIAPAPSSGTKRTL